MENGSPNMGNTKGKAKTGGSQISASHFLSYTFLLHFDLSEMHLITHNLPVIFFPQK